MKDRTAKGIALVLGAGGARGLAHVGVIEELNARHYRIEAVVGCSIGAMIGGVYCAGRLPEYKKWACTLTRREVFRLVDFAFGHPGFIKGDRVINALKGLVGEHLIENLPIPFKAVATDLDTRQQVWISNGPLFDAIRASIAIPMLLTPHHYLGHDLVDGGLLAPVPVDGAREFEGLRIIAVDINAKNSDGLGVDAGSESVSSYPEQEESNLTAFQQGWSRLLQSIGKNKLILPNTRVNRSLMDLMSRSLSTMQGFMTEVQMQRSPPDLMIHVAHDACTIYEFWRAKELIELGRLAAARALDQLEAGD